jgi:FHS family L-fucose permease-like MFS transporter
MQSAHFKAREQDEAVNTSGAGTLLWLVYFIYFFCGLTQCFESVFLPEIKALYHLGYQEQMYTILAKNLPFLFSPWIGLLAARAGCKPFLALAMALYSAGALAMAVALGGASYAMVLASFFIIGLGFTVQMVAGNPLLRVLGPVELASSRMNLGNALGAIAQILAPAMLTVIIPVSAVAVSQRVPWMKLLFAGLAVVLAVVTLLVVRAPRAKGEIAVPAAKRAESRPGVFVPRQWLGFAIIFLVLGMEAALFVMFRNYVESPAVAGLSAHASEQLLTLYFGLFAAGRLSGSWMQRRMRPEWTVIAFVVPAVVCLGGVVELRGTAAMVAVTAVGFFVSILFPTLYAMFLSGGEGQAAFSSGMLTMGFLGCAVIPVIQGRLADSLGLSNSYLPGIAIYLLVALVAVRELLVRPACEVRT